MLRFKGLVCILLISTILSFALLSHNVYTCLRSLEEAEHLLAEYDRSLKSLSNFISGMIYDEYGGILQIKDRGTGFFHVKEIGGVWWIIDPEGKAFLSKGVNAVNFHGDYSPTLRFSPYHMTVSKKYGDSGTWAREVVKRLREYGFNTIGSWSSEELFSLGMPYTIILDVAIKAGAEWTSGRIADFFSKEFEDVANEAAGRICAPRRDDPFLLGYFTDNELRWMPDWRSSRHVFDDYLALEKNAPGKRALVEYLENKYKSISILNTEWGTSFSSFEEILDIRELPNTPSIERDKIGFLEVVSRRYFQVCHDAIRRHDPNHMILGCRFAYKPPDEVLKGCGGFVNVISINNYGLEPPLDDLRAMYALTGLPIMVTEFSFKAMDSGLPNTRGAGTPLARQEDRAECFEKYVGKLLSEPYIVGYHWFQYADQPAQGRFDGENSNFGIVKINDEPWAILVARMTTVNLKAESIHRESVHRQGAEPLFTPSE
jgi:agarase